MSGMSGDIFAHFNSEIIDQMIDPALLANDPNMLNYDGFRPSIQESTSSNRLMYPNHPMHMNMDTGMQLIHSPMQPLPPPAHAAPSRTKQQQIDRSSEPWVEIIEQPKQRGLRFRYQCEGRSAGSIPGENSSNEKKTFPTIKIHNYKGQAIIVVSCVTKDPEPKCKPHPHSLVGRDCKKGVCTVRVKDASVVSFPQLGIQCAKKKDVEDSLKLRREINVDPYQTGFDHAASNIDLNVVRLCFQVFLPDANGKVTRVVPPVASHPIHDKKALNDLIICRVDRSSGKARGGDEVFLLCEKVGKDDIKVRFFEEENGEILWQGFGDFGQGDVHRQYAIVFKTPKYKEELITRPVNVNMQLFRPSDSEASESIQFTYMPEDPDPDRIEEKRRRKGDWLNRVMPSSGSSDGHSSSSSVKESLRHKLKANRRIKQEPTMEVDPNSSVLDPSMSSRGSGSSIEPISCSSSAPPSGHSIRTPDNTGIGNIIVSSSTNMVASNMSTIDANRYVHQLSQLQQQQQLFQQQQQQQVAGGCSGQPSGASSSQPGSLDSLLSYMGTLPISSLMNAIDTNTIQSFLEPGISFSSGDGNSADITGQQDSANQPDFLEVQAAIESLNKTS